MSATVRVLTLLIAVALSGCFGNSVTIEGGSSFGGEKTETVRCGVSATIVVIVQGAGSISVTVRDGGDKTVFQDSFNQAGGDGTGSSLSGEPGLWTLSLRVNSGFAGSYEATLRC